MMHRIITRRASAALAGAVCVVLGLLGGGGCTPGNNANPNEQETVNLPNVSLGVPQPGQKLFASPEEGAGVLKEAVTARDRRLLIEIFGPEGKQLVLSGDRVQENNDLGAFATVLTEQSRIELDGPDKAVLYVGKENWPFPIPLVRSGKQWFFDTASGREELINRRVGENELSAIKVCRAFVLAEKEYASKDRGGDGVLQYAQKFASSEGKKDGLYWPAKEGEELSPMGPLVAEAREEGYERSGAAGRPRPYHGYLFRILSGQGKAAPGGEKSYIENGKLVKGFAVAACPSEWGASGVMTFIVNQDGKVYQKNLGEKSRELFRQMKEYDPDSSWQEVKD